MAGCSYKRPVHILVPFSVAEVVDTLGMLTSSIINK